MNFNHSEYLLGLLILPFLVMVLIWSGRKQNQRLQQFVHESLWTHLVPARNALNERIRQILWISGMIALILAFAQPRWGFQWQEVHSKGTDLIIALDVSKSMLAEDVKPNRLTRAKRKIHDFLRIVEGDRVGLVAFAGSAFLQSPLTLDYGAIEIFLDALDTDLIPIPGSAIIEAVKISVDALAKTPGESRAVILITDGEDQSGNLDAVIQAANKGNVRLFILGIGQPEGAPIPDPQGGFVKNRQGDVVLSKLEEGSLKKLATETGGSYTASITGDLDLEKIYQVDIKGTTESQELSSRRRKLWNEQFQWFIFLGLFCFGLETLISKTKVRSSALPSKKENVYGNP